MQGLVDEEDYYEDDFMIEEEIGGSYSYKGAGGSHHNSKKGRKHTYSNFSQRQYYPTNATAGKRCRNALTGVEYEWRVGSLKATENLFHSVDTTGKCDTEGYRIPVKSYRSDVSTYVYPNPNPNHLYYDSPEQFMRHQRIILTPEFVQRWHETHRLPAVKNDVDVLPQLIVV
jgi:hypothetical protein